MPDRSLFSRRVFVSLAGVPLLAQQQTPSQSQVTPPPVQTDQPLVFRESVEEVTAPVLVFDKDDNYVNGLQPNQFHLYDNGKEQNIQVDVSYQPISLVICLQVNAHVESILPQVRKIGNLVTPLLIGEQDALDAASAFGVDAIGFPFTVFTDARGRVIVAHMGELTAPEADLILGAIGRVNAGTSDAATARAEIAARLPELKHAENSAG